MIRRLVFFLFIFNFSVNVSAQEFDFVVIPSGKFKIGSKKNRKNPIRKVELDSFKISTHEVTNAQFLEFVDKTGYVTTAENFKNANVFYVGLKEYQWVRDSTAYWRCPFGISKGGIEEKMNHPVTCISFLDVLEYCKWAHVRLPTLEEWEVACRSGSESNFFWGDSVSRVHEFANIWKNKFHSELDIEDEYLFTSPIKNYKSNKAGLYDMYGNVFEFCSNRYKKIKRNEGFACARGGSWWCSIYTCGYFNSIYIGEVLKIASFSNHGFRVVKDI